MKRAAAVCSLIALFACIILSLCSCTNHIAAKKTWVMKESITYDPSGTIVERTKLDEGSTGKARHYTINDGVETVTGHKHEGYDDHGNRVSLTAYQYQALSCRKALVFERKQELFCPQAVIFVVFLNQAFCFLCEIDHRTITVFMISRTIGHRYLVRDSSSSGVNTVLPLRIRPIFR